MAQQKHFCIHLHWTMSHLANGPWKKSLNFVFPTKYGIPKSSKPVSHWLSKMKMVSFVVLITKSATTLQSTWGNSRKIVVKIKPQGNPTVPCYTPQWVRTGGVGFGEFSRLSCENPLRTGPGNVEWTQVFLNFVRMDEKLAVFWKRIRCQMSTGSLLLVIIIIIIITILPSGKLT